MSRRSPYSSVPPKNTMAKSGNKSKKAAAELKNKKQVAMALHSDYSIIGRVVGTLGHSTFRISLPKGKEVQGLIRGVLKGGRNSEAYVTAGTYVILAESTGTVHEILGVINKKSDLKTLKEAGFLDEIAEKDDECDLFDYSDEEKDSPEATEAPGAPVKKKGSACIGDESVEQPDFKIDDI